MHKWALAVVANNSVNAAAHMKDANRVFIGLSSLRNSRQTLNTKLRSMLRLLRDRQPSHIKIYFCSLICLVYQASFLVVNIRENIFSLIGSFIICPLMPSIRVGIEERH
jgi:hypothetical protein